jgi:Arc/MetJ family transcription regulator
MRTNIVLDDDLVRNAMRYSEARTKRALVAEALETFVAVKAAERRNRRYLDRVQRLHATVDGLRLRRRPSDLLRRDRDRV